MKYGASVRCEGDRRPASESERQKVYLCRGRGDEAGVDLENRGLALNIRQALEAQG